MVRYRCGSCGNVWNARRKHSRGQDVKCPECGETVSKMGKPIKPMPKE